MNRERKESCSQVTDERGSKGGRGVGGRYQPTRRCKISGRDLTARDSCSLIWCSECICTTFQTSTRNVPLSHQSSAPAWPPWPPRWRVCAKAAASDGKNSKTKWETNDYSQAFYLRDSLSHSIRNWRQEFWLSEGQVLRNPGVPHISQRGKHMLSSDRGL